MEPSYDVIIIGGGILGCMMARELSRFQLHMLLLEQKEDVCMGITKANAAVIYAGYDHKCKTQKSGMCLRGNARMEQLCEQLDVSFARRGSIMVGFGPESEKVLQKKMEQGQRNQVPGIKLLSGCEVCALEPYLNPEVTMGLYAETTATVNPWELGIAAFENAVENGLDVQFGTQVTGLIKRQHPFEHFEVETLNTESGKTEVILTKGILNCAGVYADQIRNMVLPPQFVIRPNKATFLVFSRYLKQTVKHILFYEPEGDKRGITLVPTTDGSLLAGGTQEPACAKDDIRTTREGLQEIADELRYLIPQIDFSELIHNFAGIRPNPWQEGQDEKSIPGFVIDSNKECPGIVSMIGIKTPGLTCAQELSEYAVGLLFQGMGIKPDLKREFQPVRRSTYHGTKLAKSGKIICHCNHVTEDAVRAAVRQGAVTWEGIKHRCFTGMGRCQGSRCRSKIMRIVEEEQENRT